MKMDYNHRLEHLSLYSKKFRVRKKNYRRLIRDVKTNILYKYL